VTPRRVLFSALAVIVLAWAVAPAARGALLVQHGGPPFAAAQSGAEGVRFAARDGVQLSGTFVASPAAAGTVILVHGFKSGRAEMLDWLEFLRPTYSVLLFDSRGTGSSEGVFGVGATEVRDIVGAVDLIEARKDRGSDRIAVLGISLGAGDAILAAAEDGRIRAVVADSAWADERVQLERMSSIPIGPVAVPVLPYEAALLDALIGGRLEDARPIDVIGRIAPRPLLLIHSMDDANATTPPEEAERLFVNARQPKHFWRVPKGGHAGALRAYPEEYRSRVLAFLREALR
jgi:dipeptidyl aminopeptidase/acylaminoacyl peptidase